jgi:ElaB/YqjD/DUF883 family membrane-anchored ribosome-binding protein
MENHSTADTREALVKDVDKLKQDAAQIAQDVKAHATAHVDATRQRFKDAVSAAQARAAAHPFTILGIGFAVGFVFGSRRRRRRS